MVLPKVSSTPLLPLVMVTWYQKVSASTVPRWVLATTCPPLVLMSVLLVNRFVPLGVVHELVLSVHCWRLSVEVVAVLELTEALKLTAMPNWPPEGPGLMPVSSTPGLTPMTVKGMPQGDDWMESMLESVAAPPAPVEPVPSKARTL